MSLLDLPSVRAFSGAAEPEKSKAVPGKGAYTPPARPKRSPPPPPEPILQELAPIMDALQQNLLLFNKSIRLHMNSEINRVIVKVVDAQSDTVIKEIPTAEVQRLLARLRRNAGLFVDTSV